MKDLGRILTDTEVNNVFDETDSDKSGQISFDEFVAFVFKTMTDENVPAPVTTAKTIPDYVGDNEAEELPEDLADLPEEEQQRRIIFRAVWMMAFGTALVLLFSDPMVENLGEWGRRWNISGFYVSFVLAPFASNASELLAAKTYAMKKTQKSITTSFSTLIGAACMNNTFCLAIFYALIWQKHLAWQFTAEMVAIVVTQWLIGGVAILKTTHSTCIGFFIIACYPLCLFIVWFLENIFGLD